MCVEGFDGGWPSIFYLFGGMGVVSSSLFLLFMSETPKNQRCITKVESRYLSDATKGNTLRNDNTKVYISKFICILLGNKTFPFYFSLQKVTPWRALFTSKICIAIYASLFCFNWGGYCKWLFCKDPKTNWQHFFQQFPSGKS